MVLCYGKNDGSFSQSFAFSITKVLTLKIKFSGPSCFRRTKLVLWTKMITLEVEANRLPSKLSIKTCGRTISPQKLKIQCYNG